MSTLALDIVLVDTPPFSTCDHWVPILFKWHYIKGPDSVINIMNHRDIHASGDEPISPDKTSDKNTFFNPCVLRVKPLELSTKD